jgi:tetratricopeptide (TPR) repeat protein
MNPNNTLGYEIYNTLMAKKYAVLETRLGQLHEQFVAGKLDEKTFYDAFESMHDGYKSELAASVDGWVEAYPDSYVARLGRSFFKHSEGYHKRGFDRAHNVETEQWQGMYNDFQVSYDDAFLSLKLSPRPTLTYANLIGLEIAGGTLDQIEAYYHQGITMDESSILLRKQMLWALRPEWHGDGNFAKMDAFLAEPAQKKLPEIVQKLFRAKRLSAEGHYTAIFQNNPSVGITALLASIALEPDDFDFNYKNLGFLLFQAGRFNETVDILEKFFERTDSPEPILPLLIMSRLLVNIYDKRARVLARQGIENGMTDEGLVEVYQVLKNPGLFLFKLRVMLFVIRNNIKSEAKKA